MVVVVVLVLHNITQVTNKQFFTENNNQPPTINQFSQFHQVIMLAVITWPALDESSVLVVVVVVGVVVDGVSL